MLASCQSYELKPLSADDVRSDWQTRSPESELVRDFAAGLGSTSVDEVNFDVTDGISLVEAEVVALVFNSDLRLVRLRAGVVQAIAEHANLWDDPELGLNILRITESVDSQWIVGSALSFTVPISGRLKSEKARADAAHRASLIEVAELEWKVRHELRQEWASWSAEKKLLEKANDIVDTLNSIVDVHGSLVNAGELSRTEAALFEIEQARRLAEIQQMEANIFESEQLIRSLMGISPDAPATLISSLYPPSGQSDGPVEETNLTLARLEAEYEVAEAKLQREIREQYPDLVIGPQYESDQSQSRIGSVAGIRLPLLNLNRGEIAVARIEREMARVAYEAELEGVLGRLARLRARQKSIADQVSGIQRNLIPVVDRQMIDANRLLELGEVNAIVLLESLLRGYEAKTLLIELQLDAVEIENKIQHQVGPTYLRAFSKTS